MCDPHDQSYTLLKSRKTQQSNLIDRMSDVEFDHDNNGTPLGSRLRTHHNFGLHKVFLENQLVSPACMKELPKSMNILYRLKISEDSVSCNMIKKNYSKDNKYKVKK